MKWILNITLLLLFICSTTTVELQEQHSLSLQERAELEEGKKEGEGWFFRRFRIRNRRIFPTRRPKPRPRPSRRRPPTRRPPTRRPPIRRPPIRRPKPRPKPPVRRPRPPPPPLPKPVPPPPPPPKVIPPPPPKPSTNLNDVVKSAQEAVVNSQEDTKKIEQLKVKAETSATQMVNSHQAVTQNLEQMKQDHTKLVSDVEADKNKYFSDAKTAVDQSINEIKDSRTSFTNLFANQARALQSAFKLAQANREKEFQSETQEALNTLTSEEKVAFDKAQQDRAETFESLTKKIQDIFNSLIAKEEAGYTAKMAEVGKSQADFKKKVEELESVENERSTKALESTTKDREDGQKRLDSFFKKVESDFSFRLNDLQDKEMRLMNEFKEKHMKDVVQMEDQDKILADKLDTFMRQFKLEGERLSDDEKIQFHRFFDTIKDEVRKDRQKLEDQWTTFKLAAYEDLKRQEESAQKISRRMEDDERSLRMMLEKGELDLKKKQGEWDDTVGHYDKTATGHLEEMKTHLDQMNTELQHVSELKREVARMTPGQFASSVANSPNGSSRCCIKPKPQCPPSIPPCPRSYVKSKLVNS